jgi:hypothetical protein
MNRDETVALFLQGREAWNAWAERMLSERKALEETGRWALKEDGYARQEPKNAETTAWLGAARADFARCQFLIEGRATHEGTTEPDRGAADSCEQRTHSVWIPGAKVDFDGFLFPGYANFDGAIFSADASFIDASFRGYASFDNTKFCAATRFFSAAFEGAAWFQNAVFSGDARFDSAAFKGVVSFYAANFSGGVSFTNAAFSASARFDSVTFSNRARFDSTAFSAHASFDSANFLDMARFNDAVFAGDARFVDSIFSATWFESARFSGIAEFERCILLAGARFDSAIFSNSTTFAQTKFLKIAEFTGIKVERHFSMTGTVFEEVPIFNQADFKQSPDLDNVKFPLPRFLQTGKEELIARYRAIRRMAIQGADYEREQMAFKGEIRSKHGTEHKWHHAALWYGFAYDALSDFGRSMSRPSLIWLISIVVFSLLYLVSAGKLVSAFSDCAEAGAPHYESALIISWKNALPLISAPKSEEVARTCLYGAAAYGGMALQGFQKLWSAVLIFLFLLAVRNQFKIK